MEGKGWNLGKGLGKHGQGIVDAIKPKLKFDQTGVGHNRADEFEFNWWDHAFNKAAKSVKVDDSQGEVRVDFDSSKGELSTKKIRRKMQKEMKNRLYSNFIKSGTLTGGKMEDEGREAEVTEVKDLSKLKDLTDEELVAACGGRTAHKGSRHGLKMTAKLDRIAQAEKEYMEKFQEQQRLKPSTKNKEICEVSSISEVKTKKKKKKRDRELTDENDSIMTEENTTEEPRKKKKRAHSDNNLETNEISICISSKKKKKKHKKVDGE